MRGVRAWMTRLAGMFLGRRQDREFDQELQGHLALHIEENIRAGMSSVTARREALRALGGVSATTEAWREARSLPFLETSWQDLRYGWRMLARNREFTAVAVSALTIGVAANVLVFAFGYGILRMPLSNVPEPSPLVRVFSNRDSNVYYADYLEFRDRNRSFVHLAAIQSTGLTLRTAERPVYVSSAIVSGNYFAMAGARPILGRFIGPSDDRAGADGVTVLARGAWERRFGGRPDILGQSVTLNGRGFTVIGVAPEGLPGSATPISPDFYVAWNAPGLAPAPSDIAARRGRSASILGRLVPARSLADAHTDLSSIARDLARQFPDTNRDRFVSVYTARVLPPKLEGEVAAFILLLATVTGLVLLVACTNIASLLLARWTTRQREIGVRLALGAGRGRLVRQLLTESLLLASIAAAIGMTTFVWVTRLLARTPIAIAAEAPLKIELPVTWTVFLFGVSLALATTLICGLAPALRSSATSILMSLKQGESAPDRSRLRALLIVGQVALSTLLVVLAGVLVRGLTNAAKTDVGFVREGVLTATIDVAPRSYSPARGGEFYEQFRSAVAGTPGVTSVALAEMVPLSLSSRSTGIWRYGEPAPRDEHSAIRAVTNNISPGYFSTLRIPFREGRDFDARDRFDSPGVVIANEAAARALWPGQDALGRRVHVPGTAPGSPATLEVIGVVRDAKYVSLSDEHRPAFFRPLTQRFASAVSVLARSDGDPLSIFPAIQAEAKHMDPDLALYGADTLMGATAFVLLPSRVAAGAATGLGIVALILAAIGIYGVTSYVVRQRTREVGIRLALGEGRASIVRLLTRQSLRWTIGGMALGLVGAALVTPLIGSLLYGIRPGDPVAFIGITALIAAIAGLAAYVPGRRASRTNPMVALRTE